MDIIDIGGFIPSILMMTFITGLTINMLMEHIELKKKGNVLKDIQNELIKMEVNVKMMKIITDMKEEISLLQKRKDYCSDCGALRKLKE